MIEVVPVGTRVRFGCENDPIHGEVNAVCIREDEHITYELIWWDGRTRRTEWLERREFAADAEPAKVTRIGFTGRES